jgi:hypothetical protein
VPLQGFVVILSRLYTSQLMLAETNSMVFVK